MFYLEFLRARRPATVTLIVIAALALLIFVSISSASHGNLEVNGEHPHVGELQFGWFAWFAGFVASIYAIFLGASVNGLGDSLPALWTKPVARERMSLSIVAVDLLTLVVVGIGVFALEMAVIAGLGLLGHLTGGEIIPDTIVLASCTVLMCYANTQALTSWQQGKGGMIAGMLLGSYFLLALLSKFPLTPVLHGTVYALNFLNPLAYYGASSENTQVHTAITLDSSLKVALEFTIAVIGLAIGTFGWKRMEI
jgi:hypothetical protein